MSLAPEDSRRRDRSKSPGRQRSRSRNEPERRSNNIIEETTRSTSRRRYEDAPRHDDYTARIARTTARTTSPSPPSNYEHPQPLKSALKVPNRAEPYLREISPAPLTRSRSPAYSMPGQFPSDDSLQSRSGKQREGDRRAYYTSDVKTQDRSSYGGYSNAERYSGSDRYTANDDADMRTWELRAQEESRNRNQELYIREQATRAMAERRISAEKYEQMMSKKEDIDGLAYGSMPLEYEPRRSSYTLREGRDTASIAAPYLSERTSYATLTAPTRAAVNYSTSPRGSRDFRHASRASEEIIVTVEPKHSRAGSTSKLSPYTNSQSTSSRRSSLIVPGTIPTSTSIANAPASPMLEPYQGTYQSISPMPSPSMLATQSYDMSLQSMETLDLSSSPASLSRPRRARFHDIAGDAAIIARALRNQKKPDTDPLITILPSLSHDQLMDLRSEYKKLVKTGSERKGVNVAKHIKLCLKGESLSLMKACYTTALGQWESEAYWANFWYQGEKSRRELLIESLMGRSNTEIRAIKNAFSDKRYSDSLTKCMRTELKEDKFKKAILLVLDEIKMEDDPRYGVDRNLVEDDVRALHKCVRSEKGGESTMIEIIVLRSERHMKEVLAAYETTHGKNFAREMLKKSGNLVGELLAHILNGIISRPVRDAILLNHALSLTKSDHLRTELLISRLVRYHWDINHMENVKKEYKLRYKRDLVVAVREGTRGAWGQFCEELCVRRMPDEVKQIGY